MALPYERASSGDKAMAEIQRILQQFGCNKLGHMIDFEAGILLVQFEWKGQQVSFPASFKGYASAWLKENPWNSRKQSTQKEWEQRALDIGSIAVYSILRDWIKAQVTAVETGLISFEEVFMAHMLLPNGIRFIDHARKQQLLSKESS